LKVRSVGYPVLQSFGQFAATGRNSQVILHFCSGASLTFHWFWGNQNPEHQMSGLAFLCPCIRIPELDSCGAEVILQYG